MYMYPQPVGGAKNTLTVSFTGRLDTSKKGMSCV